MVLPKELPGKIPTCYLKSRRRNLTHMIYTIEEAAAVLKVKPRTVRVWIDSGKIKSFHLGDLVRIHEDDLQAVID
jgi:excisionase family DNA binding protein